MKEISGRKKLFGMKPNYLEWNWTISIQKSDTHVLGVSLQEMSPSIDKKTSALLRSGNSTEKCETC